MEDERRMTRLQLSTPATSGATFAPRFEERAQAREIFIRPAAAEVFFDMTVAVLWSDGPLEPGEVRRARGLANALGVVPPRGGVFGAIADGPLPFGELAFDALEVVERQQVYALAQWLIAGHPMGARRKAFTEAFRMRLGISDAEAVRLTRIAGAHAEAAHATTERAVLGLLEDIAGVGLLEELTGGEEPLLLASSADA